MVLFHIVLFRVLFSLKLFLLDLKLDTKVDDHNKLPCSLQNNMHCECCAILLAKVADEKPP